MSIIMKRMLYECKHEGMRCVLLVVVVVWSGLLCDFRNVFKENCGRRE
jgi:hypothetical protein